MEYIFIGGTYRGYQLFKTLIEEGHKPAYAVFLKEDEHEPVKYSDELAQIAAANNIPCAVKKKLGEKDHAIIREKQRDFMVVCGWRTLIEPELNNYFKLGMLAAHDSLLPKYRGFAPTNWAIINGEKESGVTLFLINEGETDSGDVLGQERIRIGENEFAGEIYDKVVAATLKLYKDFFTAYEKGTVQLVKQDESGASYTCKRTPEDGRIDWSKSSKEVFNLIRGIAPPFPGAYCILNDTTYIIHKAELGKDNDKNYVSFIPGRVLRINKDGVEVMCGKGTINITQWAKAGSDTVEAPADTVKSITLTLK
jgi:methionyl-tRNA formyltransferase